MAFDATDEPTRTLLAFIRKVETGRSDRPSYDTMFGHRPISPPLTGYTLDQAIANGPEWTRNHGSSAAGAYQFMNATLKDLKRTKQLTGKERLTPEFQDWLALALLNRRGYSRFAEGTIDVPQFAENLAKEWAGLPVLKTTRGSRRTVNRGESYYSGDPLNRAVVTADEFEAVLHQVSQVREGEAQPTDKARVGAIAALLALLAGALGWLAGLPCSLFGVFCS